MVQWHSGADLGVGVWSVRGATRLISKLFACLPQNRKSVVGGTIFLIMSNTHNVMAFDTQTATRCRHEEKYPIRANIFLVDIFRIRSAF